MALCVASLPDILEPSILPCTASTTTMASSTTIPMANTNAKSVRILMVNPNASKKKKVPTIATGTAIAGIMVERKSCKNKNTTINTNIKASINVDRTCAVLSSKRSLVLVNLNILMPGGNDFDAISICLSIPISISFALEPDVCEIPMVTALSPLF